LKKPTLGLLTVAICIWVNLLLPDSEIGLLSLGVFGIAVFFIGLRAVLMGRFYFGRRHLRYTDVSTAWLLPPSSLQGTVDRLNALGYTQLGVFKVSTLPNYAFFALANANRTTIAEVLQVRPNLAYLTFYTAFADGAAIETAQMGTLPAMTPIWMSDYSLLSIEGDLETIQQYHLRVVELFNPTHGTPLHFETLVEFFDHMHGIAAKTSIRHLFPILLNESIVPGLWVLAVFVVFWRIIMLFLNGSIQQTSLLSLLITESRTSQLVLGVFTLTTLLLFAVRSYYNYRQFQIRT
jgi:hypothetical protein